MANPRKVFSKIYNQYVGKIYRFIFLKVNSQEIAEDLTSEVFLRFWKALNPSSNPCPKPKIENPQAFVYQIARNLIIDHYREKGKAKIISIEHTQEIIDSQISLEQKAVLASDINIVRQSLTKLKQSYQEVIIWHYLDDISISEIAKILKKPEATVRVLLHRALKALQSEMSAEV